MAVSFGGFWAHGVTQNSEANMNQCLIGWGTAAEIGALNAATYAGCALFATDTQQAYYSNGSAWVAMAPGLNVTETINGVKTFGSIPELPASNPTTDNQAARKAYVDTMGSFFVASDTLLASIDAAKGTNNTSYELGRSITGGSGTLRIKFDLRGNTDTIGYGRIYRKRNEASAAIGTERTVAGTEYTTYSEDIAGWIQGDTIEVWIKTSNASQIAIRNVRVYGTVGPVVWVTT
jgi:hypothetical protein